MKHRALSMLLALLMVVSLLPIAAVAGNEEVSATAHEGKLEMRYNGSYGNGKYMPAGEHKVELRLWQGDENGTEYKLQEADKDYLHCGGAVKNVQYTATTQGEDGEESIPCWTIQLEGNEGDAGYIEYSAEGISMSRVMITLQAATGNDDKRVTEEDAVSTEPDNGPQVLFEDDNTTYYLGIAEGNSLFGSDGGCDLSNDTDFCSFALVAQVFTLVGGDYKPVSDEVREKLSAKYNFGLQIHATESCVDHYYPKLENDGVYRFTTKSLGDWIFEASATERNNNQSVTYKARLTIALKRTQAEGVLGMSYDGSGFVKSYELFAGIHRNIEFKVGNDSLNYSAIHKDTPAAQKLTFGGLISDYDYNGGGRWSITLAEPSGGETTGWIQYGTNENNRVTITVKPSHGGAVDKDAPETKIYEQGSDEFIEAERGVVTPFKWHDETYYLGTVAWSTKKPYALGGRGVNEAEDFYAACVFSLKSGEAGSSDATYELREDIRKEMMDEDFTFQLTLVPTSIGCDYYPITRTVDMTLEQQGDGSTVAFTSKWQGQKFSKASVGLWVYDACIFYSNGELFKENLSSCKYSYTVNDTVELEGSIEEINETIAAVLHEKDAELGNTEMEKNGLYNGEVTFILPKGTLAGEIVIPDTNCIVTVYGNDYGRGRIATTLEGGVRFDNDNTNHVGFIHFVGKGKDGNGNYVKWADESNQIPNEAVYGVGQGAPEVCIFEGYDIAIHSTKRPSWGSQDSIYLNNNVAICQNSNNGGQTIMRNNWFIGNNIAVMLKESVLVDYLMNFRNRFINNTIDFDNESYKVLWVSENFFYHGSWNPTEADLRRVENGEICPIFNEEGQLIVPSAPSYTKTANYKDDYNAYKAFLPRFGGFSQTYAYPIATSQFCNEMFYPNRRDPSYCPQWWPDSDPYYPSYVRQGSTISTSELDGSRFSSYDSETDTTVGTFEFSASAAETEN